MAYVKIRKDGQPAKPTGRPVKKPGGGDQPASGNSEPDRGQSTLEFNADDQRSADDDHGPGGGKPDHGAKFTDPASAAASRDAARVKPGNRKPGPVPAGKQPTVSQTTKDIATLLFTTHLLLANAIHVQRIALTQQEAEALSAASVRVMQLYDLELLPEKTLAWYNLIGVFGTVYLTRIGAAVMDAGKRKKQQQRGPAKVMTMPGGGDQPAGDDPNMGLA